MRNRLLFSILSLIVSGCSSMPLTKTDPLPSWRDTASKRAIIEFVEQVTNPGSDEYVQPSDRIAPLDNDGTL